MAKRVQSDVHKYRHAHSVEVAKSVKCHAAGMDVVTTQFRAGADERGGTVALVTNPNVAYTPYCVDIIAIGCTPPPGNISQELLALPPYLGINSGYHFRVIVSGTVTAQ